MTKPLTPAAKAYLERLQTWATTPRHPRAGNKTPEARLRSQRASLNWWRGNLEARRHLSSVKVKEWRNRRHNIGRAS